MTSVPKTSTQGLHHVGTKVSLLERIAELNQDYLPSAASKASKLALFKTCLVTMPLEFAVVVLPKACQIGFVFAQPLLMQRVIIAVGQGRTAAEVIGGLIGAAAVIYFGIAVRFATRRHLQEYWLML